MEKLMYLLWKPAGQDSAQFRAQCLHALAPAIAAAGGRQIRCMIADDDVAAASGNRIVNQQPAFDAVLSFWVDSARIAPQLDGAFAQHAARFCGFLVSESEPLRNEKFPARAGQRTEGMNQVVLLQCPPRLARDQWLHNWLVDHTPVAIETQSSFGYRQNLVVRPVTAPLVRCDAIVEENFPAPAMRDREAFYGAQGDPARKAAHEKRMIDSCLRFIDFDRIDCIPTSEYVVST